MEIIRQVLTNFGIKEVADRVLQFTASDESLDRDNEVISAKGWDLTNFRKNPVFLWVHDYRQPPIGKAVKAVKRDGALVIDVEFTPPEVYAFGDQIYRLYKAGYMKAVSVGFIPKAPREVKENDDKSTYGFWPKNELLELSAVPVPSNPTALLQGIDQDRINEAGIDVGVLAKSWGALGGIATRMPESLIDPYGPGEVVIPLKTAETSVSTEPEPEIGPTGLTEFFFNDVNLFANNTGSLNTQAVVENTRQLTAPEEDGIEEVKDLLDHCKGRLIVLGVDLEARTLILDLAHIAALEETETTGTPVPDDINPDPKALGRAVQEAVERALHKPPPSEVIESAVADAVRRHLDYAQGKS